MTSLKAAQQNAESALQEILENARLRQAIDRFFLGRADKIFAFSTMGAENKSELNKHLQLKGTDPTAVYRGLFVQVVTTFEAFVRQFTETVIDYQCKSAHNYDFLPNNIKESNIYHTGVMLTTIRSDENRYVSADYAGAIGNIGTCTPGQTAFRVNVDAFTAYLGNCSPLRLEKHFRDLSLGEPFTDALGRQAELRRWAQNAGARDTRNKARAQLAQYIKDRHSIVHGSGNSRAVVLSDVEEVVYFFKALIAALVAITAESLK